MRLQLHLLRVQLEPKPIPFSSSNTQLPDSISQNLHLALQATLLRSTGPGPDTPHPHPLHSQLLNDPMIELLSLDDVANDIQLGEISFPLHSVIDGPNNIIVHPTQAGRPIRGKLATREESIVHQLGLDQRVELELTQVLRIKEEIRTKVFQLMFEDRQLMERTWHADTLFMY
ncbi:hypothetical protein ZOSMA_292G00260 [Zostera marina]|uniref:Uncharacterized protein n=1 Tax=Zostera marina TaxID=29655 RepID=A0A0K9PCC8_ZOSMR|nr:hypothetical protein ZOSMA_292G00260 [Zostera marina]